MDRKELKQWIDSREWYQTMELSDGLRIEGKVPTEPRERFLREADLRGKSVIDIGCNSGQFCLYAKRNGASRVVGIDTGTARIEEARVLAKAEGFDMEFRTQSLFDIPIEETYDTVFCFAVVTEIPDLFGALGVVKRTARETIYLELDLAKPLLYFSLSKNWLRPSAGIPRMKALVEVRSSHGALVLSPSLAVLRSFFGPEWKATYLGKSVRYDMVRLERRHRT